MRSHQQVLIYSRRTIALVAVFVVLSGCGGRKGEKNAATHIQRGDPGLDAPHDSANDLLAVVDLGKFRPGRTKRDILADLHWRAGNVYMFELHGKAVASIGYNLLGNGPPDNTDEVAIQAIFVDGKFSKFIRALPSKQEGSSNQGTAGRLREPTKPTDASFSAALVGAPAVSVEELEKEVKLSVAPPEQTDIGLTIAWLVMRPVFGKLTASPDELTENARLRDQFNAARLDLGMTKAQVEAVFKAKPLKHGTVGADTYFIYGSKKSFKIIPEFHFSNVLTVCHEGKLIKVMDVGAGDG